ncbi:aminoglycoside phosphotransferase family protein [Phytomonospora sp. NPDC050363]|uniref:aminoglycoside phosphotransferase family protein n=1 Tax=Phytomonospora sp. NPDC050363 TaxID=3155642 RepID=UPI0033F5EE24
MDPSALLAHLGLDAPAAPIHGGWASWTFDLGGSQILRVARSPEIAAAHRREERLLPELAAYLDYAVPVPTTVGEFDGHTYMLYPRLPGRALQPGDRVGDVAGMLRRLHSFPVERAARLLGCEVDGWRAGYLADWEWMTRKVLPRLDAPLRAEVESRYFEALSLMEGFTPVLVHRDLGTEHILCDAGGVPTGIIDFETATAGDPVIDFVGLWATFGEEEGRRLIDAYGLPVSLERLHFYLWMGAAHAIRYGVDEGDESIVADGVDGLRKRLGRVGA